MLGTDIFSKILDALVHPVQWILIGDIQQLPPVFGPAVLGFGLQGLPTIELTTVYRQALESPIIRLAHRVLDGLPIPPEEYPDWKVPDQLTIHPWKKKLKPDLALETIAAYFRGAYDAKLYDPDLDMILTPFNKACGTIELNNHIANHIARTTGAITWEVVAGYNKHYLSVGDNVLYDKEDAQITHIETNKAYSGIKYQQESANLDYWGHNPKAIEEYKGAQEYSGEDIDMILNQVASDSDDDKVNKASHIVTIQLSDSGNILNLETSAEVNALLHSYSLTVHKSQGSEWRKVFLVFHDSHLSMTQRELLYTAITRAKEELYIICEPETFTKGVLRQRIKGNTLVEKAEYFKGKYTAEDCLDFRKIAFDTL